MGYLWRRRSSLLKIACLLSAVWFTVAFLIYTDDRRSAGSSAGGGGGSGSGPAADLSAHNLPLKADPFDFNNANDIEGEAADEAAAAAAAVALQQQQQHHQQPPHPRLRDRIADAVAEAPVAAPVAPAQRHNSQRDDETVDAAVAVFSNVIASKLQTGEGKTAKRPSDEGKSGRLIEYMNINLTVMIVNTVVFCLFLFYCRLRVRMHVI